jgi:hypothetical protein
MNQRLVCIAVLCVMACGGERSAPASAQTEPLLAVDVTWKNELERCIGVSVLGGEYVKDRWGVRHFVVGAQVEERQPIPSCCGPTEAVDYESRAIVRFEEGSYVYSTSRGAALRSEDRKSLSLVLPAPISGGGQETSYEVDLLCGPHD